MMDTRTNDAGSIGWKQTIYVIHYNQDIPRIMSFDATDTGSFWERDPARVKCELGSEIFYIPDRVSKEGADVFPTLEGAVAALVTRMEGDIAKRQEGIRKLYAQIGKAKAICGP